MDDHDSHQGSDNLSTTHDLIVAKLVAMSVLGIASFIIGILPIKLVKLAKINSAETDKNLVISLLLCFGGGVLLFTTFLHLQPEVRESLLHLTHQGKIMDLGHGIPMSELIFCVGFFFVYLIEEAVHAFLDRKDGHNEALHRSLSLRCHHKKENVTIPRVTLNKIDDTSIVYISTSTKELLQSQSNLNIVNNNENKVHNHHSHIVTNDSVKNSFSGLLAVLALSFHAVFEGLAVGLEKEVTKVWYLFAAIATHKFVIGFCVGVELVASKTKTCLLLIYIGTFAVVTPLGIGIGLLLSEVGGSQEDAVSAILQGMAAGTLLYVVFFEVLARERSNSHSGIWQLLAILSGFIVMFALQFATGHEHKHSQTPPVSHDHQNHLH